MKFACPKCKTRYSVSDDKLPADKTLRFTCKKCGNVFKLRRKPKSAAPATTVMGGGATAPESEPTRVANLSEIMAVKRRSREDEPETAPPASPFVNDDEWFVLSGGKQKGPMSAAGIEKMLAARLIDPRTYVWRDGMSDWVRLSSVRELSGLKGSQQGPPPPPAAAAAPKRAGALAPVAMGPEPTGETVAMDNAKLKEQLDRLNDATNSSATLRHKERSRSDAALASLLGEPTGQTLGRDDDDRDVSQSDVRAARPNRDDVFASDDGYDSSDDSLDDFDLENPGPTKERPIPNFAPEDSGSHSQRGVFAEAPSDPFFGRSGMATPDQPPDYYNAAPGEATRMFMATAGLYRRRRNQKIAAVAGVLCTLGLATIAAMDITGLLVIPGMGVMYDITGVEDPNAERAIARVEQTLAREDLSAEERVDIERRRAQLRQKLLGGAAAPEPPDEPRTSRKARSRGGDSPPVAAQIGIEEARPQSAEDHDLTAAIMGDQRKSTSAPTLKAPTELQTPNLPDGLTQESIFEVINRNQRSMSLCISQSMKAGEKLEGKMEVQMSIAANGTVESADIGTDRFNGTTIAECTLRTVKRWRFPRFNGQPVTVIFPYVLSAAF